MESGREPVQITFGTDGLTAQQLLGFFVGWPEPPTSDRRLAILRAADEVATARDAGGIVIGFATAITDGVFAASIPLVEVLPEWQERGIGSSLVSAMLGRLGDCYMIDLACDDNLVPFYSRVGGSRLNAISWRNYERLS